jgi:predicted TIM-barrel fold metal-dependent hydrolase
MKLKRRDVLAALAAPLAGATAGCTAQKPVEKAAETAKKGKPLDLSEFQPKSMLVVPESKVEKAKFPVVDVHTHFSFPGKAEGGVTWGETLIYLAPPEELLAVMNRRNIQTLVNLTGGYGNGLNECIEKYDKKHPGRFVTFTEPMWEKTNQPDYAKAQAAAIENAGKAGAKGLKITKVLGLYLRENVASGALVKIDDPRFDPMWEACAAAKLPVAIHVSDPVAFFEPIDRFNERFEELNAHPDWSFHGKDFPSNAEILEARNRVFARHPKTQFIALHAGNYGENLGHVGECLDKYPNMHLEIGARIGELGRQPRLARKFFDKYQDRIMFGTDAVPHGDDTPQQVYGDLLYQIYYHFLETEDEYFDYAPAPVPPQGRWRIYGVGLPDKILRKVYNENAKRLIRLT